MMQVNSSKRSNQVSNLVIPAITIPTTPARNVVSPRRVNSNSAKQMQMETIQNLLQEIFQRSLATGSAPNFSLPIVSQILKNSTGLSASPPSKLLSILNDPSNESTIAILLRTALVNAQLSNNALARSVVKVESLSGPDLHDSTLPDGSEEDTESTSTERSEPSKAVERTSKKRKASAESPTIDEEDGASSENDNNADETMQAIALNSPSTPSNPDIVFERVAGRLCMLTSTIYYNVTIGEISRRLSDPECLNTSVLGSILRRAKAKSGGDALRTKLGAEGIILQSGRRKKVASTLFTNMVEGELKSLTNDFEHLCNQEFPSTSLAQRAIASQPQDDAAKAQKRKDLEATLRVVSEFSALMTHPSNEADGHPLQRFQGLTHGFGMPVIFSSVSVIMNYMNTQLATVKPVEAQPNQGPTSIENLLKENPIHLGKVLNLCNAHKLM